ncbi:lipid-binding SYLF domain-containing protein [Fodinicurvata fenggangensis]|uniref:lipid-binding SYLF domain-containing protein n=1 Tax=Fodinicurvata fenggangensis TaxID=1121830 RepID=UPI0006909CDC|nr:lipid-binding SYLF domain-containing protein [Fodinicurvata fenggangensis]
MHRLAVARRANNLTALRRSLTLALCFALTLMAALLQQVATAAADQRQDAEDIVIKAETTLKSMLRDPEQGELANYIRQAEAVLIFPRLLKGGFIIGAEGGNGLLVVKGDDDEWSSPAFYTLASGSIGLQIGGQVSEAVFTVMNKGAVQSILNDQVKFGGDVSVALGPMGKGLGASTTTNMDADMLAFSRTEGLFGGGALEGAGMFRKDGLNAAYYDAAGVEPQQIVIDRRYHNPQADGLREALRTATQR